ncbi:MAG: metallophosphoesterase [Deltaproteobacteria bacterium]
MINLTSRRQRIVRYGIETPRWTAKPLKIAMISDLHTLAPWTTFDHLKRAVRLIMAEAPDLVVLGGDFLAGQVIPGRRAAPQATLDALAGLDAPLGVFGVLGNHDWIDCPLANENGFTHSSVTDAFAASPFTLLSNEAVELAGFWLAGFDSQCPEKDWTSGKHDPEKTFAQVPADATVILMAHEPDYFAEKEGRAILQLSGHTHGGQGNFFGWRPVVPSRYGSRYAYGHTVENGCHLVVSGGLGFSGFPLRIGQPPEVTVVTISAE